MFWWLWSTKKKVTVLAAVLLLPVAALAARTLLTGKESASPEASAPAVTPAPENTTDVPAPGDASEPTPSTGGTDAAGTDEPSPTQEGASAPLLLVADSSRSATKALGEIAWLATGANPANVVIPAGENTYSVWAVHNAVDSFERVVSIYEALYETAGDLVVKEQSPTLRRFETTGSVQGVKFVARVRVLDIGGGKVSVVGTVETDGVPGPVTKEPAPPTPQEPAPPSGP